MNGKENVMKNPDFAVLRDDMNITGDISSTEQAHTFHDIRVNGNPQNLVVQVAITMSGPEIQVGPVNAQNPLLYLPLANLIAEIALDELREAGVIYSEPEKKTKPAKKKAAPKKGKTNV